MPCFMKRLIYQLSEIGFPLDVNLDQCLNIPDEGDHTCENYKFSDCKPLDENLFIDATGGLFSSSDCQVCKKMSISMGKIIYLKICNYENDLTFHQVEFKFFFHIANLHSIPWMQLHNAYN